MNAIRISRDIVLEPADNERLANLCGQFDEHLRQIESRLNVEIASRGNRFRITGKPGAAEVGGDVIESLFELAGHERLDPERVHIHLQESVMNHEAEEPARETDADEVAIQTRRKLVKPRGGNQTAYLKSIRDHDLAFGIGPAGTGKTYLGVAAAVEALDNEQVQAQGFLVPTDYPGLPKPASVAKMPIDFSAADTGVRRRAPTLGEHTVEIMRELGFAEVYEVDGGIVNWLQAGLPITTGG